MHKTSFSAQAMRQLLRGTQHCTLATLTKEDGVPYGSVANLATLVTGEPLILISKLAWHTQNLLADPRASVLVSQLPQTGDVLVGDRVTVMGRFVPSSDPNHRRRYLAKHAEAAAYIDFADFSLWYLEAHSLHGVAGFGRIETLPASEVFPPQFEMQDLETSALEHMNSDHAEAIRLYATALLGASDGPWQMAAIDCDGADLCLETHRLRLNFPEVISSADALRHCFAALAQQARGL